MIFGGITCAKNYKTENAFHWVVRYTGGATAFETAASYDIVGCSEKGNSVVHSCDNFVGASAYPAAECDGLTE